MNTVGGLDDSLYYEDGNPTKEDGNILSIIEK